MAEFKAKSPAEMRKPNAELVERVRRRLIEGACEGMGGVEEIVARAVASTAWLAEAADVVAIVQSENANLIEAQARRIEELEAAERSWREVGKTALMILSHVKVSASGSIHLNTVKDIDLCNDGIRALLSPTGAS